MALPEPYYETELGKLYHGDCLEIMPELSLIDFVLCDLPYGVTASEWDKELPLEKLWQQYIEVTKNSAVIALTAIQPFSSKLVMSNLRMFKYEWTG